MRMMKKYEEYFQKIRKTLFFGKLVAGFAFWQTNHPTNLVYQ